MKTILIPICQEKRQYRLNVPYVDYVHKAGYHAMIVGYNADAKLCADMFDGLLLSGGGDIEPTYYDRENIASYWPDKDRDQIERELYWAFKKAGKPIFGICRGFQLIFLEERKKEEEAERAIEGLIYKQHISYHSQGERMARWYPSHKIWYCGNLYDAENDNLDTDYYMYVNSMHHQAVKWQTKIEKNKRLLSAVKGPIVPLAYAPAAAKEPIILEAFKVESSNVLAVQWHPEELEDLALLWNIYGEPTGANKAMQRYHKFMKKRTEIRESKAV